MFLVLILTLCASTQGLPWPSIPVFDYQIVKSELGGIGSHKNLDELTFISKELGAFIISNFPDQDNYEAALEQLQNEVGPCFDNTDSKVIQVDVSKNTKRKTSASRSDDGSHLASCIENPANVVKSSIKKVENLVFKIIDHISGGKASYLVDDSSRTLSSGPRLDHVHFYESSSVKNLDPISPLHLDNGIFLIVTQAKEAPLHVQDRNGELISTLTNEAGIIVLWGRALDQWLYPFEKFRPAPHVVPHMRPNNKRVIYARMIVAPHNALPTTGKKVTFEEFFKTTEKMSQDLCPTAYKMSPSISEALFRAARSTACDEGSAFCWMGCLVLDSQCPAANQHCNNSQNKPCCLEGQSAQDGCADMDPTCKWQCN